MFTHRQSSPLPRIHNNPRGGRAHEHWVYLRRSMFERLEERWMLSVEVTYHGNELSGEVLESVQVETVYLGSEWTTDPNLAADRQIMNSFF